MDILNTIFLGSLMWIFVQSFDPDDSIFFMENTLDESEKTLLAKAWNENDQKVSTSRDIYNEKQKSYEINFEYYPDVPAHKFREGEIENLLDDYSEFKHRSSEKTDEHFSNKKNAEESKRQETTPDGLPFIFPGTKWCGPGNKAENYSDLGRYQDTDRCCRAHDLCNDTLAPGKTKYGLTNNNPNTAFNCKCELDFRDCLYRVDNNISNTIGNIYFNLLRIKCYAEEYPSTGKCITYRKLLRHPCPKYEKDTTAPKVYQWSPPPKYKKRTIFT